MTFDTHNLSEGDVQILIKKLKHPEKPLTLQQINNAISVLFGKIEIDESVIDSDDLEYRLRIYRGNYEPERFSIHLRFKHTHHHLVRVDINPSQTHTNPDGKIITGSHIHIYKNEPGKKDRWAIPISLSDFPDLNHIIDVYQAFISYTNIN
ncbi:TPA: hypothetical protein ACGO7G_000790 [Streptococcus suis]